MKKRSLMLLCAVAMLSVAQSAQALVVRHEGVTYRIKERDMLDVIAEKAKTINMDELEKKVGDALKEEVKIFRSRDAVAGLPIAREAKQYRVDLTYTVPQDILDLHGNVLYPEGFKVNPLAVMADQGMNYPFMIIVLNGDRKAEVEWFSSSQFNNPRVKVLISDGYPYQLGEKLKRPVYQLTELIRNRFRIEATPTLVFWPLKSPYLAVRTIPVPELVENEADIEPVVE